jgi:flagellar motor switch protein FliN/FliY
MEFGELHISAVSEAMNQMMGAAATSMSIMLDRKTDISTPEALHMTEGQYMACEFPEDDKFVLVEFRMKIGDVINSPVVQIYPHDLAKAISDLFLIKKAREKTV